MSNEKIALMQQILTRGTIATIDDIAEHIKQGNNAAALELLQGLRGVLND